jgi:tRNA-specific 2-thiouridylase
VRCNRHLKFGLLLERARQLGATRVATGHYARTAVLDGHPALLRGVDRRKDQSYFLFDLGPGALPLLDFPCGGRTKDEVRALARDRGLPGADRAESQDACFVTPGGSFAEALRRHFGAPAQPGPIVDPSGRELGRHAGLHRFTLGQRRGTDVALGHRAYVVALRPEDGAVVLGGEPDGLLASGLLARDVGWLPGCEPGGERDCLAQIRYRSPAVAARVTPGPDGTAEVRFAAPQRAVTPGQAVVLYDGDRVLGGGWIDRSLTE